MKKILLLIILFSPISFSEGLDLICAGEATVTDSKVSSSSAQVYGQGTSAYGSGSTVTASDRQASAQVIFHLDDGFDNGFIQLPSVMRPPIGGKKKDKFELKNITVTDAEIKAEFRINFINKPKVTISRVTGKMEYKAMASPKNFSGDCSILDVSKKKF